MVLSEVPANATAVGVPARIVRMAGKPVYYADDVDQINMEDPVRQEINSLAERIGELERQLNEQKHTKERTA